MTDIVDTVWIHADEEHTMTATAKNFTRLFNAKGEALGIYKTYEDALDALRRRPDSIGGRIEPVAEVRAA